MNPQKAGQWGLTGKLSVLVAVALLFAVGVLGIYFDTFLKKSFLEDANQRIFHGFERVADKLRVTESELIEGIAFFREDEGILASIELINKYQDKLDYNTYLIDEEKKSLALELLARVKLSFNTDILLYDARGELITFVMLEPGGYQLHYISYREGKPILFSRIEGQARYRSEPYTAHRDAPFRAAERALDRHGQGGDGFGYRRSEEGLVLTANLALQEEERGRRIATVELSNALESDYFEQLSEALGVTVRLSFAAHHGAMAVPLDLLDPESLRVQEEGQRYTAVARVSTLDGPAYLTIAMETGRLQQVLDKNRRQLLLLLALLSFVVLIAARYFIQRGLERPLTRLMGQIARIEKSDYSTTPPLRTGDELQSISSNINQLAEAVRTREESLKTSQRELEHLSNHDPLTGLPNRRLFNQRLGELLESRHEGKLEGAILFLDLDLFKTVNDTLGHNVGDDLLVAVSVRLRGVLAERDTLARIGGDEFVILVERPESEERVLALAQQILSIFHVPYDCDGHAINITASIGIALYPVDATDSVTLLCYADLAMYHAKDFGRNRYSRFTQELASELRERTEKIKLLEDAIRGEGRFYLLYQPKIAVKNGRVAGVEALLRLRTADGVELPPGDFIQLAEETGLIIPIGSWVIEQACREFAHLLEQGLKLDHVSINLSSVQLKHSDMVTIIEEVLQEFALKPNLVELEITESYIATDTVEAIRTLQRFSAMGLRLAVDDFGTGYSSMSYLNQLPLTRIKIDKAFVDDLPGSPQGVAIVRSIIGLAKAFGLAVTAEGVEREDQLRFLEQERCDEIQGYYFAKPMTPEALLAYCRDEVPHSFNPGAGGRYGEPPRAC